jgi:hypothetical protein
LDGIDALPDENAQARRHLDGAARPSLQHETGDAHSGRWRIDGSDPTRETGFADPVAPAQPLASAFLHNLDLKPSPLHLHQHGLLAPKEHELGSFVRRLYFRLRSIICREGWQGHNTAPAKIQ